jgi:hypothetical protein
MWSSQWLFLRGHFAIGKKKRSPKQQDYSSLLCKCNILRRVHHHPLRWLKCWCEVQFSDFLLQSDASWCRHFVATAIYPDYFITCSPLAPFQ